MSIFWRKSGRKRFCWEPGSEEFEEKGPEAGGFLFGEIRGWPRPAFREGGKQFIENPGPIFGKVFQFRGYGVETFGAGNIYRHAPVFFPVVIERSAVHGIDIAQHATVDVVRPSLLQFFVYMARYCIYVPLQQRHIVEHGIVLRCNT